MRTTWILVPLLLTLGCTAAEEAAQDGTPAPSSSAPSTAAGTAGGPDGDAPDSGSIRGVVTMYGGPAGATFAVHAGTLHVVGAGTDLTQPLAGDGSFEVAVPTGRFEVYANVPAYNEGGRCSPQGRDVFRVRRDEVTEVNIVCLLG